MQLARVFHLGLVRLVYQPVVDIVERRVLGFQRHTRRKRALENVEMLFKAGGQ